jgi:outer membrane lipoprotein-sorting protein
MSVMASRPLVRWALPGGVLAAVLTGGAIATTLTTSAQASLPQRSPAQLLVDVQTARLDGVSGTVVEKADLGLPALPGNIGGRDGSASLNSLVSGSHTLRVWYSGPDKARIALLGALGESDVIRNGSSVWIWSSSTNTAQHATIPEEPGSTPPDVTDLPKTPQEAADRVLAQLDPTTNVSVDQVGSVAGRPVYTLVLTPKDTRSTIAKVTIGIDGTQHVPLEVQVFAKGYAPPAFKIGFTDVNFTRPDAQRFAFTPPPGAKVTESSGTHTPERSGAATPPKTAVIGKGWTSVVAVRMPQQQATKGDSGDGRSLDAFLGALPRVQGSWGSGRLLQSRLFSVLLTDDGRVLAGAVTGQQLLSAAADPAAALK